MNCPNCHAPVTPGAAFCDNCGTKLADQALVPPVNSAPGGIKCPGCGADNVPGSLFCDNCGSSLSPVPAQPAAPAWPQPPQAQPPQPPQSWQQPQQPPQPGWPPPAAAAIPGRFVVQSTGASLPIPPGKAEIVIGREDPVSGIFPDIDLDAYDALNQGVSRSHARVSLQGGQVVIEDLKTANYTNLRGQRLQPGQKYPLNHGDELVLGRLRLIYYAS